MAGIIIGFYKNVPAGDRTVSNSSSSGQLFPSPDYFDWSNPGYSFVNWCSTAVVDSSSLFAAPGDEIPREPDAWYAVWEKVPEPYLVTDTELIATADAIRAKTGDSASIEWESSTGFADAVAAIPSGGGVSPTAHAIFSEIRSNIDSPILAEAGETVTLTVIDTTGLSVVTIVGVGTELTGSGTINVLSWTEGKKGWRSGATKTFVMPSSDVVIRFTS